MTRSKKIFVFFVVLFVILLGYASYDIATRTTFPGSKPQLKERIQENWVPKDSVNGDSTAAPEEAKD
ncbi:MAG: hypothetical protein MUC73_08300 [Cyclobacteriaceae bacterium]|nr:hypothetical protein [Cyclobacteriaceae bacterium]